MTDEAVIGIVGKFIKEQRLKLNRTQEQLATEAGINRWTLSQIENGKSVTLETLVRLLRVLKVLHKTSYSDVLRATAL